VIGWQLDVFNRIELDDEELAVILLCNLEFLRLRFGAQADDLVVGAEVFGPSCHLALLLDKALLSRHI